MIHCTLLHISRYLVRRGGGLGAGAALKQAVVALLWSRAELWAVVARLGAMVLLGAKVEELEVRVEELGAKVEELEVRVEVKGVMVEEMVVRMLLPVVLDTILHFWLFR